MPREIVRAPEHNRNRSLGWLAVAFMEHLTVHGPGDVEGEPVLLDDELTELTVDCYALDANGRRLYDSAFISRPKGRDKSGHASRHVIFEAFGPCRFAGWAEGGEKFSYRDFVYEYQPGEPMGRPVVHPVIRCLATEEGQAGNTYDNVYYNLTEGPLAEGLPRDAAGLTRTNLPHGGEIIPSTASNAAKDGGKETFVVYDEALALDTPLPTPSGWTTMGDVRVGDMLVGSDGTPTRVVKVTDVADDRPCWRVTFADGTSVVTSDGHLWQARPCSAAKPRIRTTGEMARDGRRFRVPRSRGVETPGVPLPIDPYVLGVWLGDGDSNNATITAGDADIAEMARLIEARGYTAKHLPGGDRASRLYVSLPGSRRNRFSPVRGLKVRLREAGLLGNKHVPAEYLRAGTEQRIALLRGLMDSDGSASPSGACCFVQTRRGVADAVVELLRSLGQEVGMSWCADARSRQGGYYRITFTPHNLVPFSLRRKVARVRSAPQGRGPDWVSITGIEPVDSVPVRCVAVDADDHLFAAGAGWKITHNTHLYVLPELHRMYATVRRNMAKRKAAEPWSLETSTMYAPGENSVAEGTHELAQAIAEGKARRSRLLFDHREAPPDVDLTDEAEVIAALREVYGPFAEVMDLQRILSEIWDPRNSIADSLRYYFNQRTSSADAWLTDPEWKARTDIDKTVLKGDVITVGFDGSRKRSRGVTDATALIGCRVSDGHVFELGVWEQPDGPAGDGWRVPVSQVETAVADAFKQYRVVGFYADPAKWESYVAKWEAAYGGRLKVKASRTNPVEWWMTGGRSGLIVRALSQFHSAVVDGEMSHDGAYALSRHVLNARRRASQSGIQIAKEHPESPRKIDAAIAAVLAWQARLDALAAGLGARGPSGVPRRIR